MFCIKKAYHSVQASEDYRRMIVSMHGRFLYLIIVYFVVLVCYPTPTVVTRNSASYTLGPISCIRSMFAQMSAHPGASLEWLMGSPVEFENHILKCHVYLR